jgi:hypothetical protein
MKTKRAQVGDVIRSEAFALGVYETKRGRDGHEKLNKKRITVDGITKSQPVGYSNPDTPRGKPTQWLEIETGAYDPSRGKALFVVEKANSQGGSIGGHSPHDVFPDGWHIEARRLREDGTYNPRGEVIEFYQTGYFNCMVPIVERVGRVVAKSIEIKLDEVTK